MPEGVLYRKPPLRRDTDFKAAGMTPDCARISFDMCFDSPLHYLMETVAVGKLLHRFKLKNCKIITNAWENPLVSGKLRSSLQTETLTPKA